MLNRYCYHVDPRHIGRVTKLDSGYATVVWLDTGWISVLYAGSLTLI